METKIDYLGKVSFTIEGDHNINADYDKLALVFDEATYTTYVSRRPVPAGTLISNKKYWMRFSSLAERIIIDYNNWIHTYGAKIEALEQGKLDKTGDVIEAPVRFVFNDDHKTTEIKNGSIYLTDGANKLYLTPNDMSLYKDGKWYNLADKIGREEFTAEIELRRAIKMKQLVPSEANVKDEFVLVGANNKELGPRIKVYKDSSIEDVFTGHVDDKLTNADDTGVSADAQVTSGTGDPALCIIYFLNNGKYKLTAVPIGDFLNEALFKDGLKVVDNKVYVNISAEDPTANFLGINENKEIYLKGIQEMYNDILALKEEVKKFKKVVYLGKRVDEVIANVYENLPGLVSFVYDRVRNRFAGNGMGYVLLDKDMPFEDQVVLSNTIYEIRYEFNLFDKKVTIPENCILQFNGGYISNGILNLNETKFIPNNNSIFDYTNCFIEGTYKIGQCFFDDNLKIPKWWNGTKFINAIGEEV